LGEGQAPPGARERASRGRRSARTVVDPDQFFRVVFETVDRKRSK